MVEEKLKHLEFIQNVISRMNSNSFLIKGWAVTVVSALFAFSVNKTDFKFVFIYYAIILTFWLLDAFFLSTERKFRDLYKEVANKSVDKIDFSMDVKKFAKGNRTWFRCVFSKTLIPFYGIFILIISIIKYLIKQPI